MQLQGLDQGMKELDCTAVAPPGIIKLRNYTPKAFEGHKWEDPTKEVKLAYLSKSYKYSVEG